MTREHEDWCHAEIKALSAKNELLLRAEIERLTRYAERLRANAERDANEIARLTRLLDAFHDGVGVAAEIERLKALLRAARRLLQFNNVLYPDEIDDELEPKP